jgi:hypothetical protein
MEQWADLAHYSLDQPETRAMTAPKPDMRAKRHDALTDAAQAIIDAETLRRDVKTARLKKARMAKAIEIAPEGSKRKP